ncbi:hypothetical protein [Streptomyces sp. NPDC005485]|uniref:BlaI/MecI/CopY family transcriptional regulator n=1 Tax=Streptomyces sp. NPDC005485 TaxID=3155591 RepID=UPI0033B4A081
MSDVQAPATELMSQYTAQVTGDLERNAKEQERIAADIEALQQQMRALQGDHSVLVNMQQALGSALPTTGANSAAAQTMPRQASPTPRQNKPKKAAPKKAAAKASSAKATVTAAKPSLVDLIHGHLEQHSEPRSAAEITAALAQAHPDRNIKATVVRTTLENLVAKSRAHRAKQGSSVFYTAAATAESAAAGPRHKTAAVAG